MTQVHLFAHDDLNVFYVEARPEQHAIVLDEVAHFDPPLTWTATDDQGNRTIATQMYARGLDPTKMPAFLIGVRIAAIATQPSWVDPNVVANLVADTAWDDGRTLDPRPRTKAEERMMVGAYDVDKHRADVALLVVHDRVTVAAAAKATGFKADELKAEAEGWAAFV